MILVIVIGVLAFLAWAFVALLLFGVGHSGGGAEESWFKWACIFWPIYIPYTWITNSVDGRK